MNTIILVYDITYGARVNFMQSRIFTLHDDNKISRDVPIAIIFLTLYIWNSCVLSLETRVIVIVISTHFYLNKANYDNLKIFLPPISLIPF